MSFLCSTSKVYLCGGSQQPSSFQPLRGPELHSGLHCYRSKASSHGEMEPFLLFISLEGLHNSICVTALCVLGRKASSSIHPFLIIENNSKIFWKSRYSEIGCWYFHCKYEIGSTTGFEMFSAHRQKK